MQKKRNSFQQGMIIVVKLICTKTQIHVEQNKSSQLGA